MHFCQKHVFLVKKTRDKEQIIFYNFTYVSEEGLSQSLEVSPWISYILLFTISNGRIDCILLNL